MPNTPVPAAATGLPTADPRMTLAEKYLHLSEQRRHIDRRLTELVEIIGDDFMLPKSGLRIVASRSSALLCKGAGHAE